MTMVHWIFSVVITFVCMISCCCDGAVTVKLPANLSIPAVIVFGDSIVDQGNNNGLKTLIKGNFRPYGQDFPGQIPTGRFCNGKTPPDIIAEALLGKKDLIPAYLDPFLNSYNLTNGVSFASGGSGFDPLTSQLSLVIPLSDQLKLFQEYIEKLKRVIGEEPANYVLKNSFYAVVLGSDDLANTYFTVGLPRRVEHDVPSYARFLVSQASTFIQELYQVGAIRIGVLNVPPIGCLPIQRTLAGGPLRMCAEDRNNAARLFNSELSTALDSLATSLPDSRIVYIDIYNTFLNLVKNPQDFGFEISDKGCCGTGNVEVSILCNRLSRTCDDVSKYVFWDSYHPTEKAYRVLVDYIIQKYIDKFR